MIMITRSGTPNADSHLDQYFDDLERLALEEHGGEEQATSLADIVNNPNALDIPLDASAFTELRYKGDRLYTLKGIAKILRNRHIIPGPDVSPKQFIDYLNYGIITPKKNHAMIALKDLFVDNEAVIDYLEGNEHQKNNGAKSKKEPRYVWIDSWIDKPVSAKKLKWIAAALKQGGDVASYVRTQLNEKERPNQPELNRVRPFSEIASLGIAYNDFLEIVARHNQSMYQTGYSHAQVIGLYAKGERLLERAVDRILDIDPNALRYLEARMARTSPSSNSTLTN